MVEGLERRLCLSAISFLPTKQYDAEGVLTSSRQLAVGDFNNDGKPDIVEASNRFVEDGTVCIFLNEGGGAFLSQGAFAIPGDPLAVTVGDFNHDGAIDIAVGATDIQDHLQIYMGLGDGTFNVPVIYPISISPNSIVVADFNGDGRQDLAMTGADSSSVSVMLNLGDGSFGSPKAYGIEGLGNSTIADDFDGDHVTDLAVVSVLADGSGRGILNVLVGNAVTNPNDPQSVIADGTFAFTGAYFLGQDSSSIAPGFPDFNGDGADDLAIANAGSGTVSVLLGDTGHTADFTLPTDNVVGAGLTSVAVGAFSGSGHVDLAVAIGSAVKIRLGNGNGTFQLPVSLPLGSTNSGSLVVADLNADGKPDIAVSDVGGLSVLIAGTGDTIAPKAALAAPLTNITSTGTTAYTFKVKFTDDKAVNASTLGTGAVRVTGPHLYSQLATLVSVDVAGDGTPRTATYRIAPPADFWDASTNGDYSVLLVAGKVADTSGNLAAAGTLGTFSVKIALGAIGGFVFSDVNANGVNDPGDTRMAGVRVYLDANKNGVLDSTEKSLLTDGMGSYQFTNLPVGAYRVREVIPTAHRISSPMVGFYDLSLAAGQILSDKVFANTTRPLLTGTIFNDLNGDGVGQSTEKGLANWTVYLDANKNGVLDASEVRTLTDAAGNYAFRTLAAGSYRVREVLKAGFRRTSPAAGSYDVTLAAGATSAGKSFGNTTNVLISGAVFNDANANKLRDTVHNVLEPGLANWRVYIDANKNGIFDSNETFTFTDALGNWSFKTLQARAAAYVIRVVTQTGWKRTTPTAGSPAGSFSIVLASSGTAKAGLLFGEKHG